MPTYGCHGGCWASFRAVGWQPTGLMVVAGPGLKLQVGNLRVLWWLLGRLWGCRLATYVSCVVAGPAVGCRFTVLWWLVGRVWGCRLATYGSNGGWWTGIETVGWQPTGLMVVPGPALGL